MGRHLGSSVSALVDGQLDAQTAERSWAHALGCPTCRDQVEREGWVKRQVAQMAGRESAPATLVGSLFDLDPSAQTVAPSWRGGEAWAAVDELEHRGRTRRRAGIALVGAGSVSAAVFGMVTLGAPAMNIGGAPGGRPASSMTRSTAPTAPTTPVFAPTAPVRARIPGRSGTPHDNGVRDIAVLSRR